MESTTESDNLKGKVLLDEHMTKIKIKAILFEIHVASRDFRTIVDLLEKIERNLSNDDVCSSFEVSRIALGVRVPETRELFERAVSLKRTLEELVLQKAS